MGNGKNISKKISLNVPSNRENSGYGPGCIRLPVAFWRDKRVGIIGIVGRRIQTYKVYSWVQVTSLASPVEKRLTPRWQQRR